MVFFAFHFIVNPCLLLFIVTHIKAVYTKH